MNDIHNLPLQCFKNTLGGAPLKRRFWRMILRFLNVVEPGPEVVLSPTRLGMWVVIFIVPFLAITSPGNIAATLGALASAAPFVINYIHQRYSDNQCAGNPNARAPKDGSDV